MRIQLLLFFTFARASRLDPNAAGLQQSPTFFQIDDMLFLTTSRAGQSNVAYRWPRGHIPFSFAPGYTKSQRDEIRLAMDYIEEFTCIRFHSRGSSDQDYLYFRKLDGKCSSFVGNIRKGPQQVALDPDSRKCSRPNFPGHVLHELVHAIGFFHEHARNDRDRYIRIVYDNLPDDSRTGKNYNRNEDNNLEAEDFGVPYNYGSIMHYSNKAGSINGKETIIRKVVNGKPKPLVGTMGQRVKLSYGDILMIQSMYKDVCPGSVDLTDIPETEDIPELEDWMEDRMLAIGGTMPEMPVEEIMEESEGIIDEVDEVPTTALPELTTTTDDDDDVAATDFAVPTTTRAPNPRTTTTRRRRKPATSRRPVQATQPTVTKSPNLFNLIQYVVEQAIKSG